MTKRNQDAIMSVLRSLFSCIGARPDHSSRRVTSGSRVYFGRPLEDAFVVSSAPGSQTGLPASMIELLVRLAQEGVGRRDLFRRPGSMLDVKTLVSRLEEGVGVQWSAQKNVYTLALVVKRFLMDLPDGLLGSEGERRLLAAVDDEGRLDETEIAEIYLSILSKKPVLTQLMSLLLGIWHQMVQNTLQESGSGFVGTQSAPLLPSIGETRTTKTGDPSSGELADTTVQSSNADVPGCVVSGGDEKKAVNWRIVECEAVAKSVAGSVFHSCRESPQLVNKACLVLQYLIMSFPTLDPEAVDYFIRTTQSPSPLTKPSGVSDASSIPCNPTQTVTSLVRRTSDKAMSSLEKFTGKGSRSVTFSQPNKPSLSATDISLQQTPSNPASGLSSDCLLVGGRMITVIGREQPARNTPFANLSPNSQAKSPSLVPKSRFFTSNKRHQHHLNQPRSPIGCSPRHCSANQNPASPTTISLTHFSSPSKESKEGPPSTVQLQQQTTVSGSVTMLGTPQFTVSMPDLIEMSDNLLMAELQECNNLSTTPLIEPANLWAPSSAPIIRRHITFMEGDGCDDDEIAVEDVCVHR